MTYREKFPQLYEELDRIRYAPKPVFLTPDDIITLKLCRDWSKTYVNTDRTNDYERLCQTLERILKQVDA